ncbi:MAG: HAD family hydrolase [Candidatus Cloacimonetes bacterium]|nr:HAD family hydrolase [Candidatus Cloacimonadota bacterium]
MRPILFLDRDGTINVDRHFLRDPKDIELILGAKEALHYFKQKGYLLALVTNQSGIARGLLSIETMHQIHKKLEEMLGLTFDSIQFCPHHPEATVLEYRQKCSCRKPEPGLLQSTLKHFNYQKVPESSFLVGDAMRDCLAAQAMGLPSFLLDISNQPLKLPINCTKVPSWSYLLDKLQRQ